MTVRPGGAGGGGPPTHGVCVYVCAVLKLPESLGREASFGALKVQALSEKVLAYVADDGRVTVILIGAHGHSSVQHLDLLNIYIGLCISLRVERRNAVTKRALLI